MEIKVVLNGCFFVKTRDQIGGTLRTDIYQHENGIFQAFSQYAQDKEEEFIGVAESCNAHEAIKMSRTRLRKEWQTERIGN